MKNKIFAIILAMAGLAGIGALAWSTKTKEPAAKTPWQAAPPQAAAPGGNVHVENGTQIIEITTKGGYSPKTTAARPNTPTILKIITEGTFDCLSVLAIPSLDYRVRLPLSGATEVQIPPQPPNSALTGQCSMGMDSFEIKFIMPD